MATSSIATWEEISGWIPDPTATNIDVKGRCAVICPAALLLNILTININVDVFCRRTHPTWCHLPSPCLCFQGLTVPPAVGVQRLIELASIKTELWRVVLSDESRPVCRSIVGFDPCENRKLFKIIKEFLTG